MTTTIAPGIGAGVIATQQGTGSSPGYAAIDWRRGMNSALQEGVVEAGSYMVTQRGAGANMSVDIAASTGFAKVQGDTVTGQGLYTVPPHSAVINETITAAHASLPRVDQVLLEIQDNVHDASGGNIARTRILAGTATAGATLDNRTGATALPGSALLLADVLVPAADTTIDNTQIRDRRKWARGAYTRIVRNANAAAGSDYTTTSTSSVAVDTTNLNPRVECSGVPLRVILSGNASHSVNATVVRLFPFLDGAVVNGGATLRVVPATAGAADGIALEWEISPTAGSHLVAPFWSTTSGTATLLAQATFPLLWTVREIVRQDTANNSTTSG